MSFIAIIPARYASTRFPAKPLALLKGKPIIQHVYERVKAVFEHTYVATDHEKIFNTVTEFGGKAVMTSTEHRSGTDRIFEAYRKIGIAADVVVNVQGDEPFIDVSQLHTLQQCFDDTHTEIATLVKPFEAEATTAEIENPNSPKVVVTNDNYALYFSRSVIPYLRGGDWKHLATAHTYLKHIGLYAYRRETLERITQLPPSPLECAESLEQLRWLQAGIRIKVGYTHVETIGIDTPEDLIRAEAFANTREQQLP